MELHNTYVVQSGGCTHTACNTVSANFKEIFVSHAAWANFIVLTEENGTRTEAPCALQFINADILKGGTLRAVYTAQLEGKSGAAYKRVSVAAEAGGEDVSYADVDFTGSGEAITVKATIVLDCAYEGDILLTGGDNALVRRLLGAGEDGAFALSTGTSTYPSYPSLRSTLLQGEAETVTPSVSSGKVLFGGTKTAGDADELLLHYGGKAVLRALRSGTYGVETLSYTVQNGSVLISEKNVEMITGVTVGNASFMGYDEMPVSTHALRVNDNTLAVGSGGSVISDPGEQYVAVVTHAYAEVFEPDRVTGSVTSILRVPRTDEQVTLCRGGALALWSANVLTLYERSNGVYSAHSVELTRGMSSVIVREGVRYHVVTLRDTALYRYAVNGTTVTLLETKTFPLSAMCALARCGDYVLYGLSPYTVRSIDIDRSAEFNCASCTASGVPQKTASNYFIFVYSLMDRSTYVYDVVRGTTQLSPITGSVNGRLLYAANKTMYIYDAAHGLQALTGDFSTEKLTSACIAGGFLFTVTDGIMRSYYLSGKDIALRLPVSDNGKRCNVTVRYKNYSGGNTPVRFTMT